MAEQEMKEQLKEEFNQRKSSKLKQRKVDNDETRKFSLKVVSKDVYKYNVFPYIC